MILRTTLGLALALLAYTAYAQSTDYGSAGVVACTSPASDGAGGKRVNVIIADAGTKIVSMSIQSKASYPVYKKSNVIVNIDNPMAPPPPPVITPPTDSLGVPPPAVPVIIAEKPLKPAKTSKKDKKKPAAQPEIVQVSKVITYDLQKPVKDADPIVAKLLVDTEKNTATYTLGTDTTTSDNYPLCRAFAAGDYGAIYAWIKNQL